jgi:hypothetical protein
VELCAKINRMPNNTKKTTIGIIHQSFLFHRKPRSSLNIDALDIMALVFGIKSPLSKLLSYYKIL